jgi:hypothetical protein
MATHAPPSDVRLAPAISSLLARLRRRIRAYVWAEGLAAAAIVVAAAFWVSLALDWLFELPTALRLLVLVATGAALAYVIYRVLIARLTVRLADRNLAVLVERRFGNFRDSLLTAVELSESPDHAAEFNSEMLAHTRRAALEQVEQVDLTRLFNVAPLVRRISLALALVGAAVVFAVAAPEALGVWARRNVLLSDELWPRVTHLSVDGFDEHGRVKVARGADFVLAVKADAALGREIPEVVEVRYSTRDGVRGRENMSREGVVQPGEAPFQPYAHKFKGVLGDLEFYVHGGDDRQGPFHLDVVDSPTISRVTLHCVYPAYMHREPRDVPVSGLVQLPRGTAVTVLADANKPLVAVQIDDVQSEGQLTTERIALAETSGEPVKSFTYQLNSLDADKTLLFTLFDTDGIRSLEAVRLSLSAVADEPPQVNVQLKGIGTAITPGARLPAAGEVTDDYGIAKIWFDVRVDEKPARELPVAMKVGGEDKLTVDDALETRDLDLQPKQKLLYAIHAADGCELTGGPNVGASQRYGLEVVTPDQLRSMLEARELVLRRRFETILEELTDNRNALAAIAVTKDEKDQATKTPEGGAPETSPELMQAQRVDQNVERAGHETLVVATSFDEFHEEMVNNHIDTPELKERLKDGVADPLRRIIGERFPKLRGELKRFAGELSNLEKAPVSRASALAEYDATLVELRQVLDKMLELETFNEVLEMLREIIAEQEKVSGETKQKQKQKLKDLAE